MRKILFVFGICFVFSSPFQVFASGDFMGYASNENLESALVFLSEEGMIDSSDQTEFMPYDKINRAEFLKILFHSKPDLIVENGIEDLGNCFVDVGDEWYAPYVCKASQLGFVDGYSDGSFKAWEKISLVEASKIIVEAFDLSIIEDDDIWYKPYIEAIDRYEVIPPTVNDFDYEISRGELALAIYKHKKSFAKNYASNLKYEHIKLIKDLNSPKYLDLHGSVDSDLHFFVENGNLIAVDLKETFEIEGVDLSSFEHVARRFYKDLNGLIYIKGNGFKEEFVNRYENLDPATFSIVEVDIDGFPDTDLIYYKDKNSVYFLLDEGELIFDIKDYVDIDLESFEIIDSLGYYGAYLFKDEDNFGIIKSVYSYIYSEMNGSEIDVEIIDDFDVNTFEKIRESYFRDKDSLYFVGWSHSSGENHFIYGVSEETYLKVEGIDMETFELAEREGSWDDYTFFKDKDGYYLPYGADLVFVGEVPEDVIEVVQEDKLIYDAQYQFIKSLIDQYWYDETLNLEEKLEFIAEDYFNGDIEELDAEDKDYVLSKVYGLVNMNLHYSETDLIFLSEYKNIPIIMVPKTDTIYIIDELEGQKLEFIDYDETEDGLFSTKYSSFVIFKTNDHLYQIDDDGFFFGLNINNPELEDITDLVDFDSFEFDKFEDDILYFKDKYSEFYLDGYDGLLNLEFNELKEQFYW